MAEEGTASTDIQNFDSLVSKKPKRQYINAFSV